MFNELTMHLLPFDLAVMMLLTLLWLLHFNFVGYDDSIEVSTIHIDKSIDMALRNFIVKILFFWMLFIELENRRPVESCGCFF